MVPLMLPYLPVCISVSCEQMQLELAMMSMKNISLT
uniref:Polk protein n=2 Tax=Mus musculus TaxID=10090 RepID=Q922H5_MOUSE|nr:Polk protein [Mus musculus]